jgi:hypothetical protein
MYHIASRIVVRAGGGRSNRDGDYYYTWLIGWVLGIDPGTLIGGAEM